jgi:hypothetical protein
MNSFVDLIVGLVKLVLFLAVVLAVLAFWGYNKIHRLSENVKEAWSNIAVVTRKKVALVNQLIDVVKGYQESEKLVMLKISDDLTVGTLQQAHQQTGAIMTAINGMAQRFPELKSGQQYSRLVDSIQESEANLEGARTRYNAAAKEYNVVRTTIPHVFYSGLLGFHPAAYLDLDAVESADAGMQKPMISDDGERVNELLGMAASKMLGAAKRVAEQGRLLAEKGAAHLNQNDDAAFHYLDAQKNPKRPVTRLDLDQLFQSGEITAETDLLPAGEKSWKKYKDLPERQAASSAD